MHNFCLFEVLVLCLFFAASALGLHVASSPTDPEFTAIGVIDVPHAAFVVPFANEPSVPWCLRDSVIVTSFNPVPDSTGEVYILPNISAAGPFQSWKSVGLVDSTLTWPNEVTPVPEGAIPQVTCGLIVCDGFLVPSHQTGGVYLVDMSTWDGSSPIPPLLLVDQKKDWFYHRAHLVDLNQDGLVDILTCRATDPVIGEKQGELVWFEQPSEGALTSHWTEHVLMTGPDIFTTLVTDANGQFPSNQYIDILASEFFGNELNLIRISLGSSVSVLKTQVLLDGVGAMYDASLQTLTLGNFTSDCRNECNTEQVFVVTNTHLEKNGSIFSSPFDIQDPFSLQPEFRVIYDQFPVVAFGPGQAAPGFVDVLWPASGSRSLTFGVATDGGESFATVSHIPGSDWGFNLTTIFNAKGIVGYYGTYCTATNNSLAVLVPNYTEGQLLAFESNQSC